MYESTVKQSLVKQPLILGLEKRGMMLGAIPTLVLAALSIYWGLAIIAAAVYGAVYWSLMLRAAEYDSQFPTIWFRFISGKGVYRSYGGSK